MGAEASRRASDAAAAQPFRQCPFWQQVGTAAFGGWDQVDVGRVAALRARVDRNRFIPLARRGATSRARARRSTEYTSYYARLYAAITEVSGCALVIDSSKHPSLAHCLRWQPDVDLRVLHLVRDSRAVAYSWSRPVRRPDSDRESYMTRYSPAMAAGQWNAQNAAFHLLARLGAPTMRLKYEDFMPGRRPRPRDADFAGLPGAAGYPFLGTDGGSLLGPAGGGAHRVRATRCASPPGRSRSGTTQLADRDAAAAARGHRADLPAAGQLRVPARRRVTGARRTSWPRLAGLSAIAVVVLAAVIVAITVGRGPAGSPAGHSTPEPVLPRMPVAIPAPARGAYFGAW